MIPFGSFLPLLQSQHSHLVIQQLLGHLDANSKNSATVRAGIVEVLLEAAAIAASGSVGKTQVLSTSCPASCCYQQSLNYQVWIWRWVPVIIGHCSCRSYSVGGVQHAAAAAPSQRRLWADRLLWWQHQHWYQDHKSSWGEAAAGGCHQDHWWVREGRDGQ